MKLLICDVEGTIFKTEYFLPGTDLTSTIWQMLAYALGEDAINEELRTHKKWADGGYSNYIEWMKETIEIHLKYGLTQDVFNQIINAAKYNVGVLDFFANLNRNKFLPIFISGGFQNLTERAQKDLNVYHSFSACTYFFSDNKLCGYNLLPSDFVGKLKLLEVFSFEYGLTNSDWIFIGDGKNDVKIAENCNISIGINPHPDLKKVVTYSISNFHELNKIWGETN